MGTGRRVAPTIGDVAEAAGVARSTAAAALSPSGGQRMAVATRDHIRAVAASLGYQRNGLAAALSVGRVYTIGLVCELANREESTNRISVYQKDIMMALARAAGSAGLRLTMVLTHEPGDLSVEELTDGRVDGLVVASVQEEPLARALFGSGFPVVTVGSGWSQCRVAPDNRGGLSQAVDHLVQLGHRRIAYVGYGRREGRSFTTEEREAGYREAMADHRLAAEVVSLDSVHSVLAAPPADRPTGLVCFNDGVAFHLLRLARAVGLRVPADLSVVGFDDTYSAWEVDPPLTTVEHPYDRMATAAVDLLCRMWAGGPPSEPPPVPTRLLVRESTGQPSPGV